MSEWNESSICFSEEASVTPRPPPAARSRGAWRASAPSSELHFDLAEEHSGSMKSSHHETALSARSVGSDTPLNRFLKAVQGAADASEKLRTDKELPEAAPLVVVSHSKACSDVQESPAGLTDFAAVKHTPVAAPAPLLKVVPGKTIHSPRLRERRRTSSSPSPPTTTPPPPVVQNAVAELLPALSTCSASATSGGCGGMGDFFKRVVSRVTGSAKAKKRRHRKKEPTETSSPPPPAAPPAKASGSVSADVVQRVTALELAKATHETPLFASSRQPRYTPVDGCPNGLGLTETNRDQPLVSSFPPNQLKDSDKERRNTDADEAVAQALLEEYGEDTDMKELTLHLHRSGASVEASTEHQIKYEDTKPSCLEDPGSVVLLGATDNRKPRSGAAMEEELSARTPSRSPPPHDPSPGVQGTSHNDGTLSLPFATEIEMDDTPQPVRYAVEPSSGEAEQESGDPLFEDAAGNSMLDCAPPCETRSRLASSQKPTAVRETPATRTALAVSKRQSSRKVSPQERRRTKLQSNREATLELEIAAMNRELARRKLRSYIKEQHTQQKLAAQEETQQRRRKQRSKGKINRGQRQRSAPSVQTWYATAGTGGLTQRRRNDSDAPQCGKPVRLERDCGRDEPRDACPQAPFFSQMEEFYEAVLAEDVQEGAGVEELWTAFKTRYYNESWLDRIGGGAAEMPHTWRPSCAACAPQTRREYTFLELLLDLQSWVEDPKESTAVENNNHTVYFSRRTREDLYERRPKELKKCSHVLGGLETMKEKKNTLRKAVSESQSSKKISAFLRVLQQINVYHQGQKPSLPSLNRQKLKRDLIRPLGGSVSASSKSAAARRQPHTVSHRLRELQKPSGAQIGWGVSSMTEHVLSYNGSATEEPRSDTVSATLGEDDCLLTFESDPTPPGSERALTEEGILSTAQNQLSARDLPAGTAQRWNASDAVHPVEQLTTSSWLHFVRQQANGFTEETLQESEPEAETKRSFILMLDSNTTMAKERLVVGQSTEEPLDSEDLSDAEEQLEEAADEPLDSEDLSDAGEQLEEAADEPLDSEDLSDAGEQLEEAADEPLDSEDLSDAGEQLEEAADEPLDSEDLSDAEEQLEEAADEPLDSEDLSDAGEQLEEAADKPRVAESCFSAEGVDNSLNESAGSKAPRRPMKMDGVLSPCVAQVRHREEEEMQMLLKLSELEARLVREFPTYFEIGVDDNGDTAAVLRQDRYAHSGPGSVSGTAPPSPSSAGCGGVRCGSSTQRNVHMALPLSCGWMNSGRLSKHSRAEAIVMPKQYPRRSTETNKELLKTLITLRAERDMLRDQVEIYRLL